MNGKSTGTNYYKNFIFFFFSFFFFISFFFISFCCIHFQFTEIQKECDDFEYHRMEMEVYRCNLQQWEMLFQEAKENYLFGSATLYQLIQTVYSKERAWMMEKMISSEILKSKELPEAFYEIQPAGWKQATPVFKYFLECLGQGNYILLNFLFFLF